MAWFSKILEAVNLQGRKLGLANDELNELLEHGTIIIMYLFCLGCVCPNYRPHAHSLIQSSQFFEKQHVLPRGVICRRITHVLIGYSIPVTHWWLQVNLPISSPAATSSAWVTVLSFGAFVSHLLSSKSTPILRDADAIGSNWCGWIQAIV